MAKTAKEVVGDVITLIKADALASTVDGDIYREGYRPRDSRMEDIVVIHTAGVPGQISRGVVTIHVYVPDIEFNGVTVENGSRCEVIERALQSFAESLTADKSCYLFRLQATVTTEDAAEIEQHFAVAMLAYEYFI